jgi:uncharacterized membrane protein YccC
MSRKRAWLRFYGTLGGGAMAAVALAFITDIRTLVLFAAISCVLNGLLELTALGKMSLFYTATILLLYSANDISSGGDNVLMRSSTTSSASPSASSSWSFPRMVKLVNPRSTIE